MPELHVVRRNAADLSAGPMVHAVRGPGGLERENRRPDIGLFVGRDGAGQ